MQSSRSLRSLGHLTAPRLCYRKATAPSNAAYCGVSLPLCSYLFDCGGVGNRGETWKVVNTNKGLRICSSGN